MNTEMESGLHIMVDWETMGLGPTARPLSFGAFAFTFKEKPVYWPEFWEDVNKDGFKFPGFYRVITPTVDETTRLHLHVDDSTLRWWLSQPSRTTYYLKVQKHLECSLFELYRAFDNFIRLSLATMPDGAPVYIWANGADFDIAMINYHRMRLDFIGDKPWAYNAVRDTRTFWAMCPKGILADVTRRVLSDNPNPPKHFALYDAWIQAQRTYSAWVYYKGLQALAYGKSI